MLDIVAHQEIIMPTHYSTSLVIISFVVAALGSFMGLIINKDALTYPEVERQPLLLLAGLCLGGVGIWSMHFIGMLAMSISGMTISYDWGLTVLSFIVSVAVAFLGLSIISRNGFKLLILIFAGFNVGLGIVAMHYTGMIAMRIQASIIWDCKYIVSSALVAIAATTVALGFSIYVEKRWQMCLSALIMATAICGMHYIGMAAASFMYAPNAPIIEPMLGGTTLVALAIMIVDIAVILIATLIAIAESNKRRR